MIKDLIISIISSLFTKNVPSSRPEFVHVDWLTSWPLSHHEGLAVPVSEGFEGYEEVVVIFPNKRPRTAVDCPGRLVPDHLPRGEDDLVAPPVIVLDVERPVLLHLLAHIEDGGDDVSVEPVHMGGQPRPVGVPPSGKMMKGKNMDKSIVLFRRTCLLPDTIGGGVFELYAGPSLG